MLLRRILVTCFFIFLVAGWAWTFVLYQNSKKESYEHWERWLRIDLTLEFTRDTEEKILSGDFEDIPMRLAYIESGDRNVSDPTLAAFCEWQVYPLFDDLKSVFSDDFAKGVLARLSDEDRENLALRHDFDVSKYGVDFSEHRVKVVEGLKTLLFDRMREVIEQASGN
ncbi:hypothetical protein J7K50_01280 [bacterium]|nr:hypothetical protein [bacterium]